VHSIFFFIVSIARKTETVTLKNFINILYDYVHIKALQMLLLVIGDYK